MLPKFVFVILWKAKVTFLVGTQLSIFAVMDQTQRREGWILKSIDFAVLLILIGILCSKAALSIGMALLFVGAVIAPKNHQGTQKGIYFFFPLLFLLTLLSGINSSEISIWSSFLLKKLPFLVLPYSFFRLSKYMATKYRDYLVWFVMLAGLVSLGVLTNYLMNIEEVNLAISKGKSIQTPIDHSEFSIFIAFAAIISGLLWKDKASKVKLGTNTTKLYSSIFLIVFVHILAVRSGLAVLYLSIIGVALWLIITTKKTKLLVPFLLGMILMPLIAINTIPSLKKKLGYSRYDLTQFKDGQGLNYSDSERLYSLNAGWQTFKENPVFGVGIGDLKKACDKIYLEKPGKILKHYPHNQYLFIGAAYGVIGLILFLIALLGPIIQLKFKLDAYYLSLLCITIFSGLVENTLERTLSSGFYLFFALLSISYLSHKWESTK